jgi:hypothetical protein
MQAGSLTRVFNSSSNSNKGKDNIYFPTVQELIARHAPKAVNKLALGNNDFSINPNLGSSQGKYTNSLLLASNLIIYK